MKPCRCRLCAKVGERVAPPEEHEERISPDTLYTAAEVAGLVKVSRKVVYAMADAGQLPAAVRIGRRMRFRGADLLGWLENLRKSR